MATTQQISALRKRMVQVARASDPRIAYSAVDHLVGLNVSRNPHDRSTMGMILADIGAAERKSGRPFLPAVVVRKWSKRPGPGFYNEVRIHYPKYRRIHSNPRLHSAVLADVLHWWWMHPKAK